MHTLRTSLLLCSMAWTAPAVDAADRPDLPVADFEGGIYGDWKVEGDAFGKRPAEGALPGQMAVAGFAGKGLANSFHGGDDSEGSLTSPSFKIERKYLNFLIGGGGYAGETCVELIVEGKTVRTATASNTAQGGSENLDWFGWDVADLTGREASLKVVDRKKGGWGHINVDQFVQSDAKKGKGLVTREFVAEGRYLQVPVRGDAEMRRVKVESGGKFVDEFDVKLADKDPDFLTFLEVPGPKDAKLSISAVLPLESKALEGITASGRSLDDAKLYKESLRPGFHFTSKRGWLNDPNGLVYIDGEYHLFYQHNPYGWDWGNMHWGHAVSPDLIHWTELAEALTPIAYNDWCFSGSAVVDVKNTSGFGDGQAPPLVGAYTSTGRGECIVFSNDRGRTWKEFEGNPVVKHVGRDPRLLWHGPSERWIMAVYDEADNRREIVFHSSADLKSWKRESAIGGFFECPDLYELAVEGDPSQTRWVLYAADGEYLLGSFDGRTFTPENPQKKKLWYGDTYAAQTFSNAPDGRRIHIGWGRGITFPGMPFNQQMTVPCDLTLRKTADGLRLCANPVKELEALKTATPLEAGGDMTSVLVSSDFVRVKVEAEVSEAGTLSLFVRGVPVVFNRQAKTLTCSKIVVPFDLEGSLVKFDVLVDRGSVEVFADDGRIAISAASLKEGNEDRTEVSLEIKGGGSRRVFKVDQLKSAW